MSTLHANGEIIDRQTVRFERLLPGPIERVSAYLTEWRSAENGSPRATWICASAGGRR